MVVVSQQAGTRKNNAQHWKLFSQCYTLAVSSTKVLTRYLAVSTASVLAASTHFQNTSQQKSIVKARYSNKNMNTENLSLLLK